MIRKTKRGYQVVSMDGKPLSRDNLSHAQAKRRMMEVERFKAAHKNDKEMGKKKMKPEKMDGEEMEMEDKKKMGKKKMMMGKMGGGMM